MKNFYSGKRGLVTAADGVQMGSFYYGYTLNGEKKDHLNSWCTMFSIQVLMMYGENIAKKNTEMGCFV